MTARVVCLNFCTKVWFLAPKFKHTYLSKTKMRNNVCVCISFYSVIAFSRWNGYTLSRSLSLEKPFITDGIGIKPTKITKIIENDQWRKRRSNEMLFVRVVLKNWTERKLSWCLKFRKINIYRKKVSMCTSFCEFCELLGFFDLKVFKFLSFQVYIHINRVGSGLKGYKEYKIVIQ